jgi:DNA polymerase-3 subunit beta
METKKLKQSVNLIVRKENMLPVLDNVFIDNGDIVMSDLDVTLRIKNYFDQKFSTLVNAKKFVSFLELAKPPVVFEEGSQSNSFTDSCGKVSLGKSDSVMEFPLPPKLQRPNKVSEIRSQDIQKYSVAAKFTADDQLRPVMNCVCHEEFIVASDAHKLYFVPAYKAIKDPLLVPGKVIKLLELYPDNYKVISDDHFVFLSSEKVDISYRKVDGLYPAWRSVVPQKFNFEVTTCIKAFIKAIDYVKPYMNKISETIKIDISENELRISSEDLDFNISAEIKIKSSLKVLGEENKSLTIGFKYSFMKKICSVLESDELVIKIVDPTKAAMFGEILLMPMMIH